MIKFSTSIPFEVGCEITSEILEKNNIKFDINKENNRFSVKNNLFEIKIDEIKLILDVDGFGAAIVDSEELPYNLVYEDVASVLKTRNDIHYSILKGQHAVNSIIEALKDKLKSERKRADLYKIPPYAYTTVICDENVEDIFTLEQKRCAFVLLEPFRIGLDDTLGIKDESDNNKVISLIKNIDEKDIVLNDIDLKEDIKYMVNYETGLMISKNNEEVDICLELSLKSEIAWVTAIYIQEWARKSFEGKITKKDIGLYNWQLSKLFVNLNTTANYNVSNRYILIQEGLNEDGKLNREIENTKLSIELLNKYIEKIRYQRQRKNALIRDCLLFFFASASAIELFFELPIFKLNFDSIAQVGIAFVIAVIGLLIYRTEK